MESLLEYMIVMTLCSGIFFAIYRFLLHGTGKSRLLRIFILSCTLLSAAVPFLEIPIYPSDMTFIQIPVFRDKAADTVPPDPDAAGEGVGEIPGPAASTTGPGRTRNIPWLTVIYIVTAAGMIAGIPLKIRKIRQLKKTSTITASEERYILAENPAVRSPFSFIRTIYIGKDIPPKEKELIICHERSHIRHRHSEEKLAMAVLKSLFWFNPFIWLFVRQLEEVQETEADRDVLAEGHDIRLYRITIFKQLFGYYPEISCGLKNSLTLKRFKMMTEHKKPHFAAVRWIVSLILIAGTTILLGATTSENGKTASLPQDPDTGIDSKHFAKDTIYSGNRLVIQVQNDSIILVNGNIQYDILNKSQTETAKTIYLVYAPDTKCGVIADLKKALLKLTPENSSTNVCTIISDKPLSDSVLASLPETPDKNMTIIRVGSSDK